MADLSSGSIDKYTLFAQTTPGLLAALPLGIAVYAWFPKDLSALGGMFALVMTCGATIPLAHFARARGKRLTGMLFDGIDGQPTTRFLRHRSDKINRQTKLRYHSTLGRLVQGTTLPTPEEEACDCESADGAYSTCVDLLREQTRDPAQFPVLYSANITYGYRRNSLGIRDVAIWSSLLGFAACLLRVTLFARADLVSVAMIGALLNALSLMWWIGVVKAGWVRDAADDYALRLLGTCDKLMPPAVANAAPPQASP